MCVCVCSGSMGNEQSSSGHTLQTYCAVEKRAYDECFDSWYSGKFLRGDINGDGNCAVLFEKYQACIIVRFSSDKLNTKRHHHCLVLVFFFFFFFLSHF